MCARLCLTATTVAESRYWQRVMSFVSFLKNWRPKNSDQYWVRQIYGRMDRYSDVGLGTIAA